MPSGSGQLSPAAYYHGKTVAEVAEILNLPEATVKTRMFYARRKLAQLVHATGAVDA
jgi:RNA polymerase sigma-70 factor (ECF subfamily)